jgi:hypothetical protein
VIRFRRERFKSVEIMRVQPGDTVVFTTDDILDLQQHDNITATLRANLPDGVKVLVLAEPAKLSVVRAEPMPDWEWELLTGQPAASNPDGDCAD